MSPATFGSLRLPTAVVFSVRICSAVSFVRSMDVSAGVASPSWAADRPCTCVVLSAPIWVLENKRGGGQAGELLSPQRIGLRGRECLDFGRAERADLRCAQLADLCLGQAGTCVSVRRSIAVVLRTRSWRARVCPD